MARLDAHLRWSGGTEVWTLFDTQGRPVPWKIHSQMPQSNANERYPFEPIAILGSDRDGRAEFVATGRASPFEKHPMGGGWIEAVYSAEDARLTIVKSPNLKSYRTRVGALNARPGEWRDRRGDLEAKPWERIESIATGEHGDDPSEPLLPSLEERRTEFVWW